jgi:hypothetical protein
MSLIPTLLSASLGLLLATVSLPALASGARQGVTPRHGEMVLLREVSTRHAYRQQPPGMAVIVDPSPQRELSRTLGTATGMEELSDGDYAALGAGAPMHAQGQPGTVSQVTSHAVNGSLGRVLGRDGVMSGNRLGGSISGPMGNVGRATAGIGDHVRGALAQFPLGQAANTGKGP